jgi:hypothetical protein
MSDEQFRKSIFGALPLLANVPMTGVFVFSKWAVALAIVVLVLLEIFDKPCQQPYSTNIVFEPQVATVAQASPVIRKETADDDDLCRKEFHRITKDMNNFHVSGNDARIPGVTDEDLDRSVAHVGNRFRLAYFVNKLTRSSSSSAKADKHLDVSDENADPVTVVVCGGSISLGHGVNPSLARYSDLLENWLNLAYPISAYSNEYEPKHRVYNRGSHGADVSGDFTILAMLCVILLKER